MSFSEMQNYVFGVVVRYNGNSFSDYSPLDDRREYLVVRGAESVDRSPERITVSRRNMNSGWNPSGHGSPGLVLASKLRWRGWNTSYKNFEIVGILSRIEGMEDNCSVCISPCKKEEVCVFYQPIYNIRSDLPKYTINEERDLVRI